MRIDERTVVPLTWVLFSLSSIVISVSIGAFWVKEVNDRLFRIEEKLGITPLASSGFLKQAKAGE